MNFKVLIVEDDPMVAQINSSYLSNVNGFTLSGIAKNVGEAIEFLQKNSVDLVLLDIFLGDSSGTTLLTYIRENDLRTGIVVLSAAKDKYTVEKSVGYGVIDYIIKPFTFERFTKALSLAQSKLTHLQKDEYHQTDIDNIMHAQKLSTPKIRLPKGIDINTLKLIWSEICQSGNSFGISEISTSTQLSRVTIKKYMDFLCQAMISEEEINYGSLGRPSLQYQIRHNATIEMDLILSSLAK